jgi:hypothetical protein
MYSTEFIKIMLHIFNFYGSLSVIFNESNENTNSIVIKEFLNNKNILFENEKINYDKNKYEKYEKYEILDNNQKLSKISISIIETDQSKFYHIFNLRKNRQIIINIFIDKIEYSICTILNNLSFKSQKIAVYESECNKNAFEQKLLFINSMYFLG